LREIERTWATLVEKAKGPVLADLDREAADANAVISGMSDPVIRTRAQQA